MVAEVVAALNPPGKDFSSRNLTDVFDSFLNDKAGGRNLVSSERIQNRAINRPYFDRVNRSSGRNVSFRDRKVVKSDRNCALLRGCGKTTDD